MHAACSWLCSDVLKGVPRIPDWGHPLWVALSPPGQPSKQRLMDVKSFFQYTEEAGTRMTPHPAILAMHAAHRSCCNRRLQRVDPWR